MDILNRIENDFKYHAPNPDQVKLYKNIREFARTYAKYIALHCPESREQAMALTKLDEVVFWANASIARNSKS